MDRQISQVTQLNSLATRGNFPGAHGHCNKSLSNHTTDVR
jgi:hypothetical protein